MSVQTKYLSIHNAVVPLHSIMRSLRSHCRTFINELHALYSLRIYALQILAMYVGGLACPTGPLRLKRYDHARFQLSQSNSETIGLNYDGCILYSLMFPVQ